MGMLDAQPRGPLSPEEARHQAATALETQLLKSMLTSSGAFKPSGVAGGSVRQDLFVETLAEAVAKSGGAGLGAQLEAELAGSGSAAAPSTMPEPMPASNMEAGVLQSPTHVTSGFGTRADPFDGHLAAHHGVDLSAPEGTPIQAMEGGTVKRAGDAGGYGNLVEIDHGNGRSTVYAHASQLLVTPGQIVEAGQPIARVGHTGRATGPHLHFELRQDGRAVDPRRALKAYSGRVE